MSEMSSKDHASRVDFVTLGMLILDDIYPSPSSADQTPQKSILGGAGTFSALGARLFSPPPLSHSISWIVDRGTDFPADLRSLILSWNTGCLFRDRGPGELTTRGWNGYSENEHRAFKYLTEKKRLTAEDLTPQLLAARSFHLICSPTRCVEMIERIHEGRSEAFGDGFEKPLVVWEPVPDLCVPSELEKTFQALKYVDVMSPNHEELGSLFGFKHDNAVERKAIESQANQLLARGIGATNDGAVVIRAGKEGCFVATLNTRKWLPAYHQDSSRVVDPTGGGNGFLGGFAAGLVRSDGDVVEAGRWGSVAASFCIEQVGVPVLETVVATATCVDEVWNGESVADRLEEYRARTG